MTFWSNVLIPVTSMMITVFATLYTVSQRVKNENREKHKPYLTLNNIEQQEKLDEYKYYLTLTGRNYIEKQNIEKEKTQENKYISVTLLLDNIGYGVASNIKFYNLLTGKEIRGTQTPSKDKNQKLFTTFDIASNQEKKVQAKIINTKKTTDEIEITDHCRMLCVYQDLNGNIYNFVFVIDIKSGGGYSYYAYQPSSHSYQQLVKKYSKQKRKIFSDYTN